MAARTYGEDWVTTQPIVVENLPRHEKMYTALQVAKGWGISKSLFYKMLANEFAHLAFARRIHPKVDTTKTYVRGYTSGIRIPESVERQMWLMYTTGKIRISGRTRAKSVQETGCRQSRES
jgi:hypothetical protein